MDTTAEQKKIIEEEQKALADAYLLIRAELAREKTRFSIEEERSRELTAGIVATRRLEEKVQLASDEALAHAMRDMKQNRIEEIETLLKRPYFARIKVRELVKERVVEYEYKLGLVTHNEARIIDWRKAPISKLYYEYREGDHYSELIQEREREGEIIMRRGLEIHGETLRKISTPEGDLILTGDTWTFNPKTQAMSIGAGGLQEILSLITPEQFRLITEEATTAVLIQGVAGSGKTTVALHRLAWLLHHENSGLTLENAQVIVRSEPLLRFVRGLIDGLNLTGLPLATFPQWAEKQLKANFQHLNLPYEYIVSAEAPPTTVQRIKRAPALATYLEALLKQIRSEENPLEIWLKAIGADQAVLQLDDSHLLDRESLRSVFQDTRDSIECGVLDMCDLSALLLITQHLLRVRELKSAVCDHIVVDEIQDLSPFELATIRMAVPAAANLTLVGDEAQRTAVGGYISWDELRKRYFEEHEIQFTTLTVSHRSTLPIMQFADALLGKDRTTAGRPGKAPLWFRCRSERTAISEAINWVNRVREHHPNALVGVIVPTRSEVSTLRSLLRPSFGHALNTVESADYSFDAGVLLTDIERAKGLEFFAALLWNPSAVRFPHSDDSARELYVAATRAIELLTVITATTPSPLLARITPPLVRVVGEEVEEP
jgi:DNA helicase-2/ATP-dependent DNA helicase PcrA